METVVPPSASTIEAKMSADAFPAPRLSRPEAVSFTVRSVLFISTTVAVPEYSATIGPTLTFIVPS